MSSHWKNCVNGLLCAGLRSFNTGYHKPFCDPCGKEAVEATRFKEPLRREQRLSRRLRNRRRIPQGGRHAAQIPVRETIDLGRIGQDLPSRSVKNLRNRR